MSLSLNASPIVERAAQYLRASTEHQRYSTQLQAAAISQYAALHGYEVVRTFVDDGVSGLTIRQRSGLQSLLAEVVGGNADYTSVLVYDVSRWGRFQNPDQSAHYEFICAEAGVQIIYCAEQFANDGSLSATILKSLKRVMAAEYSRELSVKITAAHARIAEDGYWQGGAPGYGLRRQVVRPDGRLGPVLEYGQFKNAQGSRSVLTPGPAREIEVVQRIYRLLVTQRLSRSEISRLLNAEGIPAENGGPWSLSRVTQVVTNRKYLGEMVTNKSVSRRVGEPRSAVPCAQWITRTNVFEPIIDARMFASAQRLGRSPAVRMKTSDMVEGLRAIFRAHGAISARLIRQTDGLPGPGVYLARLGAIRAWYAAIGATYRGSATINRPRLSLEEALERLRTLYGRAGFLSIALINDTPDVPSAATYIRKFGSMSQAYALVGFVQAPFSVCARLASPKVRMASRKGLISVKPSDSQSG